MASYEVQSYLERTRALLRQLQSANLLIWRPARRHGTLQHDRVPKANRQALGCECPFFADTPDTSTENWKPRIGKHIRIEILSRNQCKSKKVLSRSDWTSLRGTKFLSYTEEPGYLDRKRYACLREYNVRIISQGRRYNHTALYPRKGRTCCTKQL